MRLIGARRGAVSGRIDNISDEGLGLTLNGYFPNGSGIKVKCKDWVLRGTIMHSSGSLRHGGAAGYSCGIRMEHLAWDAGMPPVLKEGTWR